jgi:hypothetical protein
MGPGPLAASLDDARGELVQPAGPLIVLGIDLFLECVC